MISEQIREQLGEELAAELEAREREMTGTIKRLAVSLALQGKVHNVDDVLGLLDLAQVTLGEDGRLADDPEALVAPIREAKPYLFRAEQPPLCGAKPGERGGGQGGKRPEQMTYSELCAYLEEHPGAEI